MLLFNRQKDTSGLCGRHSNTSHVIIQLRLNAIGSGEFANSNTSHVIIQWWCQTFRARAVTIQIHLMLLFNLTGRTWMRTRRRFKYISCYYSIEYTASKELVHSRFKYISCYYSITVIEVSGFLYTYSNTSHVIIQ